MIIRRKPLYNHYEVIFSPAEEGAQSEASEWESGSGEKRRGAEAGGGGGGC